MAKNNVLTNWSVFKSWYYGYISDRFTA